MAVHTIKLGTREVQFPSAELQPLQDCNHLLGDRDALWEELNEKGYLLIRGMHNHDDVLQARLEVLKAIKKLGSHKLEKSRPLADGVLDYRCDYGCIPSFQGKNNITQSTAVSKVIEGHRPYSFFKTLFGEDALTFDYKWLRAIHRQAFTGAHVDNVYMARGTSNLLTMWTPFGDVDPTIGCLAVCEGSNQLPGFDKMHSTYSQVDVEQINLNGSGWFTTDPFEITNEFGGQWKTTTYKAGDVLIFGMKWQPASQAADPRYVGDFKSPTLKFGLNAHSGAITMEELKAKWGFQ